MIDAPPRNMEEYWINVFLYYSKPLLGLLVVAVGLSGCAINRRRASAKQPIPAQASRDEASRAPDDAPQTTLHVINKYEQLQTRHTAPPLHQVIKEKLQNAYTIINDLQHQLENEVKRRKESEEWCDLIEKELSAHVQARQEAENKCAKLNKTLANLKLRLKHNQLQSDSQTKSADVRVPGSTLCVPELIVTPDEAAPTAQESPDAQPNESQENVSTECHVKEPAAENAKELPHADHLAASDRLGVTNGPALEPEYDTPDDACDYSALDAAADSEFELGNDVIQQLVINTFHAADLSELLMEDDALSDSEESLSDLVAANTSVQAPDTPLQNLNNDDPANNEESVTIPNEKDCEPEKAGTNIVTSAVKTHADVVRSRGDASVKRASSLKLMASNKPPLLKPSGKPYSLEAESRDTSQHIRDICKHWESNQRKWGSSHIVNDESSSDELSGDEHCETVARSANFTDLQQIWANCDMQDPDRCSRQDVNANVENIARDKSPAFQALKDKWEAQMQESDESI